MILSANPPYFAPYPGFFCKVLLSDIFVVLDAVQFPRGTTWISRNRFKNDQGTLWMTVPVSTKGRGLQPINAVRIASGGRWAQKHRASLAHAYAKAPYWPEHRGFITTLYTEGAQRLIDLNMRIIRYLAAALQMDTKIVRLSELDVRSTGDRRLVDICRLLGADTFLVQRSALAHLNRQLFERAGIRVRCFTPWARVYPQLWGDFIPNLSVLDMLLNCGPKAGEIVRAGCRPSGPG